MAQQAKKKRRKKITVYMIKASESVRGSGLVRAYRTNSKMPDKLLKYNPDTRKREVFRKKN